jgi:hypothetical protein
MCNDAPSPHALAAFALGVTAALAPAAPALGVEGGLGRSISAMQITPFAGVLPSEAGFIWSLGYLHYGGDIGGTAQVPIGGQTAIALEVDADFFLATGVYVWETPKSRWNFASMLTVPYIAAEATADEVIGPFSTEQTDSASDLYDLYFAPFLASYHVSPLEHWALGVYIYAPTADYEVGKLANPGLNTWTFTPAVSCTKLFKKGAVELSAQTAIDFYSENDDTDYQNGDVFRLEGLLMVRNPSGWGFGAVAGWIQQLNDDEGGTITEALDGFRGHSLGAGPALSHSHKGKSGELDVNFRWVFEFDVEDRFEGDGPQLTFGFHH